MIASPRTVGAILLAIASAGTLPGCVTDRVERSPGRLLLPDRETASGSNAEDLAARLRWSSVGSLDYDDFSIPLLAPDGSRLVVRSGAAPRWPEILAGQDARPLPEATFSIHVLDEAAGLRLERRVSGPWILGRNADDRGFLVEEPLANGARRIGRVDWETGKVAWLVDDGSVASGGWLGPGGMLAHARRPVNGTASDLVVRFGDGTRSWEIPSKWDRSWVDPVIAPDGRTVFALRRGDGTVELGWSRLTDESRFRDGIECHPISARTNPRLVWSMLSPQTGVASPPSARPRIVFLHPDLGRLVEWTPGDDLARPFPEGTINAVLYDEDDAIAATNDGLDLVRLADGAGRPPVSMPLTEDTAVPRLLGRGPDGLVPRFVLFRPGSGRYDILVGELPEID